MVRILKWLMVLSQDKSVLVTMQDVVIGKPKSKWGIAVNTLCTIFTVHHFMEDLSATAAVTKAKEICIYLIWPVVHISTKQSLHRSMRLFSGRIASFITRLHRKLWYGLNLSANTISKCNSRQYRPSLSRAWNYFLISFTNSDNVTE